MGIILFTLILLPYTYILAIIPGSYFLFSYIYEELD